MNRSEISTKSAFHRFVGLPGTLILALLFLLPVSLVLLQAFVTEEGIFTLSTLRSTLFSPYLLRVLLFTLTQALVSTVASLLLALPGAYLLATYEFKGKRFIRALTLVPFVLPSILVVLGFVLLFGNNGFINQLLQQIFNLTEGPLQILYSFKAIILAHAFYNFPLVLGIVASFWERLPQSQTQVAATLGAKRATIFRTVTLPRLIPAILSASSLVFLFCFSSFAIILVLGGGPRFTTMEVEIYRQARMMLNTSQAAALSLLSIVVALIFVILHSWAQKRASQQELVESPSDQRYRTVRNKSLGIYFSLALYLVVMLVLVIGPLVAILYRSLLAQSSRGSHLQLSLQWYRQLFSSSISDGNALQALLNTVLIAAAVALISVTTTTFSAISIARRRLSGELGSEIIAMLPLAVSSVIIGLGYYLIALRFPPQLLFRLTLVVLAHVVIASPLVLRTVLPSYRSISSSYLHVALTLGATPARTFFSVVLPLLRSALVTGAAFAFAISLGELNATLVLSDSQIVTLPVVMYRLISSYHFQAACALGTILIGLCLILFLITESFRSRHV